MIMYGNKVYNMYLTPGPSPQERGEIPPGKRGSTQSPVIRNF
jgi:hypothetical protein